MLRKILAVNNAQFAGIFTGGYNWYNLLLRLFIGLLIVPEAFRARQAGTDFTRVEVGSRKMICKL